MYVWAMPSILNFFPTRQDTQELSFTSVQLKKDLAEVNDIVSDRGEKGNK